ncbi:MAG: chloride channel protein [Chitinophagales bacterium]|nr:chloride channel protein [Chitinophagales bacterium]
MNLSKKIKDRYFYLIVCSLIVAFGSSILAVSLMLLTEYFEKLIFDFAQKRHSFIFIFLPTIGITCIFYLRKYLFKKKRNKGIREIYKTIEQSENFLPFFKVPSHYINGFLTVIFGGSTGIEVSTVVATAALGNNICNKKDSILQYRRELISAGVAAGIAVLFNSPFAGFLFAIEVIAKKLNKSLMISCGVSILIAKIFLMFIQNKPILPVSVKAWNLYALPFMIILSLLGGLLSIYFTFLVTRLKRFFSGINNNFIRVNLGAIAVGTLISFFPFIYGDSYYSLWKLVHHTNTFSVLFLFSIAMLKPLASSLTLGAGGDGGVFAPSIVAGAFLGVCFALICNTYFDSSLIILNFALIGAATTLTASIYAPFTSLFLICNLVFDGYHLFLPLLICCLIAHYFAKLIFPYNVYTYSGD